MEILKYLKSLSYKTNHECFICVNEKFEGSVFHYDFDGDENILFEFNNHKEFVKKSTNYEL